MGSTTKPPAKAKRNRAPKSCGPCRSRKTKCDQGQPFCGSCSLRNIAHLCSYRDEQPSGKRVKALVKDAQKNEKIDLLKQQIRLLESGSSLNNINTTLKKSDFVGATYDYAEPILEYNQFSDLFSIIQLRIRYFGLTATDCFAANDDAAQRMFRKYLLDQKAKYENISHFESFTYKGIPPFLTDTHFTAPKPTRDINVLSLPSQSSMMFLINWFFDHCQRYFPFISKEPYLYEIAKQLDGCNLQSPDVFRKLSSKASILLILLRVSYICLPFSSLHEGTLQGPEANQIKAIEENGEDILITHVELAKDVIFAGGINRIGVREVQAALFLYTYKLHSCDDDGKGTDLVVILGSTIQMAKLIGLHRVFSQHCDFFEMDMKLGRVLWSYLAFYEAISSFDLGSDSIISDFDSLGDYTLGKYESVTKYTLGRADGELKKILREVGHVVNNPKLFIKVSALEPFVTRLSNTIRSLNNCAEAYPNQEGISTTELLLRLHANKVIIECLMIIASDRNNNQSYRNRYLSRAFESSVYVIRRGVNFLLMFLNDGYWESQLSSPLIWDSILKVFPFFASFIYRIVRGDLIFKDMVTYFNLDQPLDLLGWLNIDLGDDFYNKISLISFLNDFYDKTRLLTSRILRRRGLNLNISTRIAVDFFQENFPELCERSKFLEREDLFFTK